MEMIKTFESAEGRFGTAGPLMVALYRGATSLALLEELDRSQATLITKYPRISTLSIISVAGTMFKTDESVRTRSVALGKKYEKNVIGSAIVVTTKGLGAVMARTFLSGFFLLSKTEFPMKTFANIAEGLSWLQSLPGQDLSIKTEFSTTDLERFIA